MLERLSTRNEYEFELPLNFLHNPGHQLTGWCNGLGTQSKVGGSSPSLIAFCGSIPYPVMDFL